MNDIPENLDPSPLSGQILIYEDGASRLQVRLDGETAWLSQRLIAELYQVTVPTVNEHLSNIYEEAELDPEATIRKFRIVRQEGTRQVTRAIEHYRLEAILAKDELGPEDTADSHQLTYTLENALARIESAVEDLEETLEAVHVASERYEVETVRTQGSRYLEDAAKLTK